MGFGWTQDAELGKAEQQVADLTVTSGDLTFGDETRSAFEQHCVCSFSISELLGLQIWIHGVMECVSRRISSWSLRERIFKLKTESDQTILDTTVMKSHLMDYRKSLKTSKANRSPPFSLLSPHPFHNFFFVFAVSRSSVYPLSNSTSAQYVTLQLKIGCRKVKTCWFGSAKWLWPNIFIQFAEAGKRHNKA
jgi:hypothetical protein